MKTSPRFLAPGIFILALLASCRDPELESLQAENHTRKMTAELQRQHREDRQALAARMASLERARELLSAELEAARVVSGSPPLEDPASAAPVSDSLAVSGPEEDDDYTAKQKRKISTYQAKGLGGIPPEISAEIVRRARRDTRSWAALDDIGAQKEGYLTVQAFAVTDTDMLRDDRDQLVYALKREHPGDWASMARQLHQQVDAWKVLEEWKLRGVPGLETWETEAVLCGVRAKYPYDWSSALQAVGEEARRMVAGREKVALRSRN
ncbi:hypothetical protein [Luteolibacter sp. Populi]|uniref:hypothetical protein n=1 Tax=Luteolibacter sp. Populi TaxID=3230487 RepID=UPI003465FF67